MHQNRLRDLREDKDMNQTEFAELLRVHQTTYSDYELGKLNIPVSVLHTLADYYNVSVDYLLGRTKVKEPYPKNNLWAPRMGCPFSIFRSGARPGAVVLRAANQKSP